MPIKPLGIAIILFGLFFAHFPIHADGVNINELVHAKSAKYGVDPQFVKAIIGAESGGNIKARSPVGALGLMQLMPNTAARFGVAKHELFIPERNIEAGVKYISVLSRLFNNDKYLVAAAYNAGEGAVQKYNGIPPYRETRNYVPRVMARYTGKPIQLSSFSRPRKLNEQPKAKVAVSFVLSITDKGEYQPVFNQQ